MSYIDGFLFMNIRPYFLKIPQLNKYFYLQFYPSVLPPSQHLFLHNFTPASFLRPSYVPHFPSKFLLLRPSYVQVFLFFNPKFYPYIPAFSILHPIFAPTSLLRPNHFFYFHKFTPPSFLYPNLRS
jgi:hypothetical protein